jgi:hypothetical protein
MRRRLVLAVIGLLVSGSSDAFSLTRRPSGPAPLSTKCSGRILQTKPFSTTAAVSAKAVSRRGLEPSTTALFSRGTGGELEPTTSQLKINVIKYGTAALAFAMIAAFASQSTYLHEHANQAMIAIFALGYIGIIFEEVLEFNKAGVALLMSTGLWVTYADYFGAATGQANGVVLDQLREQLAEVSDICFFLLAASTIVEVVDGYEGFAVVTNKITTTSKKQLFWTIGFLTFFLSAILNNLTVTIVMVSLLRKIVTNNDDRRLFGAMVVVAANAGGVWTPIGE